MLLIINYANLVYHHKKNQTSSPQQISSHLSFTHTYPSHYFTNVQLPLFLIQFFLANGSPLWCQRSNLTRCDLFISVLLRFINREHTVSHTLSTIQLIFVSCSHGCFTRWRVFLSQGTVSMREQYQMHFATTKL